MKNNQFCRLLAAGTSLLAFAATSAHGTEARNAAGILSEVYAEGGDNISVLRIPAGVDRAFGGAVVSDHGKAVAIVARPKGRQGGAIRQKVEVEDGDGGATLINSGQVTIAALAEASSDRPRKDVTSGAFIRYAVRQDVDVDSGHSVDLAIVNNGVLKVISGATSSFALAERGSPARQVALAVTEAGTVQHAEPREHGSATVTLENRSAASLAFSTKAVVAAAEDAEGEPARRGAAIALLGEAVSQRAWGVEASAVVRNSGLIATTTTARADDVERAEALAATWRSVSQAAVAEVNGLVLAENSGDVSSVAAATAVGARRADAAAVVLQGVGQNVSSGDKGTATLVNSGSVSSDADAQATAGDRARATGVIGQVVGQYVISSDSQASIVNSGQLEGTSRANATAGQPGDSVTADRAAALATVGAPRGGLQLKPLAFGRGLVDRVFDSPKDDKNEGTDDDSDSGDREYGEHGREGSGEGGYAAPEILADGPLSGLSQVAIGSTASIENAGRIEMSSLASAAAGGRGWAGASMAAVSQSSQGEAASTEFNNALGSRLSASADSLALADAAIAKSFVSGVAQEALGESNAGVSFTSAGDTFISAGATAKAASDARSTASVSGIEQIAGATTAFAEFVQSGMVKVQAQALSAGAAADSLPAASYDPALVDCH